MNTQLATEPVRKQSKSGLSLRLKLTLLAIGISAIPMAVVGFALIDVNETALETSLREHFFTIIDSITEEVDTTASMTEADLNVVGMTLAKAELTEATRIELVRGQVAAQPTLPWVAIYDEEGRIIDKIDPDGKISAAPETLSLDLRDKALADGRVIGSAIVGEELPEVLLVVPMRGERMSWFIATRLSLEPAQEAIERFLDRRHYQDHYVIYVADSQQRALAHSNRELAATLSPLTGEAELASIDNEALSNGIVMHESIGSGEDEAVAAVSSMRSLPWKLVVKIPRSVAYRSFSRMRLSVLLIVLVIIFAATIAAVFFARRITKPISTLVGFASDLAARRFHRVNLKTRDEISILGDALSDAALELAASDEAIRQETEIRNEMGRFLPSQIVDQIVRREASIDLGGERREITVLFADVANFTPLVEKHSAEEVVIILNELFTILTEIVFRHGGTVDKFIGDCVMAFWGAPNPQKDHAARALAAAEEMIRWLEIGNESWWKRFGVRIQLAIGVNTGEAVVGNFGSESRMEYTAIGDVVNVAARLETRARPQQILISDATRQAAGDDFEFHGLGSHKLAGRSKEVELFEVNAA